MGKETANIAFGVSLVAFPICAIEMMINIRDDETHEG